MRAVVAPVIARILYSTTAYCCACSCVVLGPRLHDEAPGHHDPSIEAVYGSDHVVPNLTTWLIPPGMQKAGGEK